MAQEGWDDVNELLRQIRVDASGRLIIVPFGQYLETPPSLSDEDYYQITLTSDGKLRTDDPTTQAKVDEVLAILESETYGNEAIRDAITAAQEDLDNPGQYKADVSALAVEATLTAIKGTSWSTETLKAIYDLIAGLTSERGTDGAALASVWTSALASVLANYSAVRAGYLDQLDFALQEAIAAIPTTMVGTNNAALASAWTAALATALGNYTQARAVNLDQLDFALQEAIAAIPTTMVGTNNAALASVLEDAMQKATGPAYNQDTDSLEAISMAIAALTAERGTDNALLAANYVTERGTNNALLAANYVTERGTDGAALASAWTAALATALGNYTQTRAENLDQLDFALQEAIAAIPTTMVGTNNAALASAWTSALATALGNYTSGRAAYLDQLDFNLQEAIAAIPTTMVGTNNAALASAWTAALATVLGNYSAVRAGYLDQLDFNLQEAIAAIPTTAMRGTDNALLASDVGDVLDELLSDHTTAMSFAEALKWALFDLVHLYEHFDAITALELKIPFTSTLDGTGSMVFDLDNEPSAVQFLTGAADNNDVILDSDRTVSLVALGGSTLICEIRFRLSTEAHIMFAIGLANEVTNSDRVWAYLNTDSGGADIESGCLLCEVDGAAYTTVDAGLLAGYDLTTYNVIRLEFEPGDEARLYVNDTLKATQTTDADIPADQKYRMHIQLRTVENAVKHMFIDYWKAWSE